MKAFRFPLAKVLHWRRVQLELEENKLKRLTAALAQLDRSGAELAAASIRAEMAVRTWSPLAGRDLAALAGFRAHVRDQERTLAVRRTECLRQIATQQDAMLAARRRCRLLERLEERQLHDWRLLSSREIEQLAAESHLSGLARRRLP